jgi:hypothetical protein
MTEETEKRRSGRPRILFTEEDKKEYRRKYNAQRENRKVVYKTCEICNKVLCSQNFNTHKKTQKHIYLLKIKSLTDQLEKQEDNNIS